jgi:RHS repeat-associated protein
MVRALSGILVALLCSLSLTHQAHAQFFEWEATAEPGSERIVCTSTDSTTVALCYLAAYNFSPTTLYPRDYPNCGIAGSITNDCIFVWACATGSSCSGEGGTLEVFGAGAPADYYISTNSLASSDCGCDVNNDDKVSDPISPSNGNVYHEEVDIPAQGANPQSSFQRYYNSAYPGIYNSTNPSQTDLGAGWRHSFTRMIVANVQATPYQPYFSDTRNSSVYSTPASACTSGWSEISATSAWPGATASFNSSSGICSLSQGGTLVTTLPVRTGLPITPTTGTYVTYDALRDDGQVVNFTVQGSTLVPATGSTMRLTLTSTGYQLIDDDDNVELYNASGQLLSVTSRSGIVETMAYDSANRLSTVTDSFGHQLTLDYNAQNLLTSVTDPASHNVQYGFNSYSVLSTVTNLDSTNRTYVYESPTFPKLLTGIIDESATRFSTWGYDAEGRGNRSQEAGGADATTLVYASNGSVTTTDALGAQRTFTFNLIGNQNRVTSISGSQCSTCDESAATTYDGAGFVASRTDYNGNVTCYANDPVRGLELVRVEGFAPGSSCPASLASYTPTGIQRKISTAYSPTWREPVTITEANRTTSYSYDGSGNALTKTVTDTSVSPNVSRTWTYTYNAYGQPLTIDGPRTDVTDVTTIQYYSCSSGSQCGQIQTITNALGQVTTFNTYNAYGQPLTITDPNGVVTTLTYDARDRITSSEIGTETTSYSYWPTGLLKLVTLPDSSTIQYTYDGAHRLTTVTDGAGNYLSYTLDALGNHTADKSYDPSGTLHRNHTRVFNTLSRLYQDINAAGTAAVTTTLAYDSNGNPTAIDAPMSRNTGKQYDALNRLSQITDPNSGITQLGYDANDNLASVIDPRGFTTSYSHNGFNDVVQQVSPDTGTSTTTYDSGGNVKTATDARGAAVTYTYDALNRVTQQAYTDDTTNFTYDSGSNGKGRLTGITDPNYSMSWAYDTHGRVTGKAITTAAGTVSVGYGYANADRTAIVMPSGATIAYTYTNHRITSITVNGTIILSNATYEPFGGLNGWTWGNSTTESRTYDQDGKITQLGIAGDTLQYGFDNASRITSVTDAYISPNNWSFGYDVLDRITAGSTSGTSYGWTHDANGNRQTQTGTNAGTYTIAGSSNQIASSTGPVAGAFTYDAAGNTASIAGVPLSYNQQGRLTSLNVNNAQINYLYNALGQMIAKSVGGVTTVLTYDEAGHLLGEYSPTTGLIQETVWMGDTPIATIQPTTGGSGLTLYYVHTDNLNTPRIITRPSDNTPMWAWTIDPFGTTAALQNPYGAGNFVYNLRFPGQYYQAETGIFQNYYRDYFPSIGRYLESDPIGLNGGSYSTYAYASGNPITRIDPLGLADTITDKITSYIAQGNIQGLEDLIEAGGLDPAQQRIAQAGLQQIQILSRSTSSISRLADAFKQSGKVVRRAIEQCKQAGLPKSGPIRNPDVVVDLTTGEVYPQLPGGGLGDSIGNLTEFLPKN